MRKPQHVRLWAVDRAALMMAVCMTALGCGGGESPAGDVTYCDVEPIFVESCQRCHSSPLKYDAPFALTSYEEIYPYRATIRSVVKSEYMPYLDSEISPPVEKLSGADKELIISWVDQGAPNCP